MLGRGPETRDLTPAPVGPCGGTAMSFQALVIGTAWVSPWSAITAIV